MFAYAPLVLRRPAFYGITAKYRKDPAPFRADLPKLFDMAAAGTIAPRLHARLGLLDARKANEMLEAGGIEGKIVLCA